MSPSGYFPRAFATGASIGAGGTRSADIRGLRSAFGDLDYLQAPPNASPTYTPPVSSAIKRFQGDFGLKQDGVIVPDGPTEQALNFALEANRAGGTSAFEISRDAVHRLNQSGLRFIRDTLDFGAFGMWQDRDGNRVAPAKIGAALGDRFNSRRAALPDRAAETLTRMFGPKESKTKNSIARASAPSGGTTGNRGTTLLAAGNPPSTERLSGSSHVQTLPDQRSPDSAGPKANPTRPTKRPASDAGNYSLLDITNLKNPVRLKQAFQALFVDESRRQRLFQAASNMERFIGGSAKTLFFTGKEARGFTPIKRLEAENQKYFTDGILAGTTARNRTIGSSCRNSNVAPTHRIIRQIENGPHR